MASLIRKIEIITENEAALGGRRKINKMVQQGYVAAGYYWHRTVRPEKFTAKGARKGHFQARKTKNILTGQINKNYRGLFRAPNPEPLVWSGTSRSRANVANITSTSKAAWLTYQVGNLSQPGKPKINKVKEFRVTARADKRKMQTLATREVRDQVRKFRRKTKITINIP